MKLLLVSIFAPHFINWTDQLRNTGYEIYWLDVFDSNTKIEKLDFVEQNFGWRYKFNYPGRYWIKNNYPLVNRIMNVFNERNFIMTFEKELKRVKPDVVQSFVMQAAGFPILNIMKKFPSIKWVYSAWGNDLFYRMQNTIDLENIRKTLPEMDFMFADCARDYQIALSLGFKGVYLGTFPTGGGYDFKIYDPYIKPNSEKQTILIKGYQGNLGRCNNVLKSLIPLKNVLAPYEIVVFGANTNVEYYAKQLGLNKWKNFTIIKQIPHIEVLKLFGKSFIYVGNSISDGMPNTLLEAIIMGVFPIQSNPGGATEELIRHEKNGMLIENPEDSKEIENLIRRAVENSKDRMIGVEHNLKKIKPSLERNFLKKKVVSKYKMIENQICQE